ncbi:HET-domain-containing protein [Xylariaceae sp. FL1272]|nr:HET-domain-containing protein [Xylariaceae sp. FL1272]
MLQCRGFVSPPHKFFTPKKQDSQLCQTCRDEVFSQDVYRSLVDARRRDLSKVKFSRTVQASQLRAGMLSDCQWCCLLGNSVLTAARKLSEWYTKRNFQSDISWYWDDYLEAKKLRTPHSQASSGSESHAGSSDKSRIGSINLEAKLSVGNSGDDEDFEMLDCAAVIHMITSLSKSKYSRQFELIEVAITATPTRQCSRPWLFISKNDALLIMEATSEDGSLFPGHWKALSPTHLDWPIIAKSWLDTCRDEHKCPMESGFRPTRLIETTTATEPRLVLSATLRDHLPYLTLSYVWGTTQKYVLTRDTLEGWKATNGLDTRRLPQTIVDALHVTRQLGFRYLWVDALCIMQDSQEDKLKELPMMGQIYRHSAMTIIAACSSSAEEGFLKAPVAPRFSVEPFQIHIGNGDDEFPAIQLTLGMRDGDLEGNMAEPINRRGWTLQEHELPSCRLHFTSRGITWSCTKTRIDPSALRGNEHQAPRVEFEADGSGNAYDSESGMYRWIMPGELDSDDEDEYELNSEHEDEGEREANDIKPTTHSAAELRETRKRREFAFRWIEIRAEYVQRALSNPTDRLPAISAIAAIAAQGKRNRTYLAGLWKDSIFDDLRWSCQFYSEPSTVAAAFTSSASFLPDEKTVYVAPSWSWASVKYDNWAMAPSKGDDGDCSSVWDCEMLDYDVQLVEGSDFVFGAVRSGYLELKGRMLFVEWGVWDDDTSTEETPDVLNKVAIFDSPRGPENTRLGEAYLDFPTALLLDNSIKLESLILTKQCDDHDMWHEELIFTGLLLVNHGTSYQRIGLCSFYSRHRNKFLASPLKVAKIV